MDTAPAPPRRLLEIAPRLCAALVGGIALLALAGWAFRVRVMAALHPRAAAIHWGTAAALLLAAVALALLTAPPMARRLVLWARAAAILAALVGVGSVGYRMVDPNVGQEDARAAAMRFGPPAPATAPLSSTAFAATDPRPDAGVSAAVELALLGGALLLMTSRARRWTSALAQGFVLTAVLFTLLSIVGQVYGVDDLYVVGHHAGIPPAAAGCFLLMAVGILCLRPDHGVMALTCDSGPAGWMMRHLLPAAAGIPFLLGWLVLRGVNRELYDPPFAVAVLAVVSMVLLSLLIWESALTVGRSQRELTARNEVIEKGLEQARGLQQFLLPPSLVRAPGVSLARLYRAVQYVGGDFVDVHVRGDGTVSLLLADVAGHGVSSAMMAAMIKAVFLRFAPVADRPEDLLTELNRDLASATSSAFFASAVACQYDPGTRSAILASAGHPGPLLLREGSAAPTSIDPDLALLLDASYTYRGQTMLPLQLGDRLLFFTDGASEATSPAGSMLGTDGLCRLLSDAARRHTAPGAILDSLFAGIWSHAQGRLKDDVALLLLEVTDAPPETHLG